MTALPTPMSTEPIDAEPLLARLSLKDRRPPTPPEDTTASRNAGLPGSASSIVGSISSQIIPRSSMQDLGTKDGEPNQSLVANVEDQLQIVNALSKQVERLLDRIYEIQELRHSASPSTSVTPAPAATSVPASRIDTLLFDLDSSVAAVAPQVETLVTNPKHPNQAGNRDIEDLLNEWKRASEQYVTLKEEVKEDGWLIRFRTTADQAEAMIDPLAESLQDLSLYATKVSSSKIAVPFESELEGELSMRQLHSLILKHESMKGTYVPSINKILNLIGRSISDRSTKNGEALRRFAEMQNRWTFFQRQTQQLDAKIRLIFSQYRTSSLTPAGDVEILSAQVSPFDQIRNDYFGIIKSASGADERTIGNHRSSVSSGVSLNSVDYRSHANRQTSDTLSPEIAQQSLRRRPSGSSVRSASTAGTDASRPPWNISTKPEKETQQTPTNRRYTSYGSRHSQAGSISPTPSSPSVDRSIQPRPSVVGSRIPVISPKSKGSSSSNPQQHMNIPALAVSTSHTHSFLSEPPPPRRTSDYPMRPGPKTPEPRRSRPSVPMSQPRPSVTPTNRYFSSDTTPRTAPLPRHNSARAPPSSFRAKTPTPGGTSSRPASRMSVASYSNYNAADLQPFQPSKYDLLDQYVQSIMEETAFNLFVGRVDLAMRKGQRKRDDEEWKGDFVFGAGEKPVGVKLLRLAGRTSMGVSEGPRMKCLVRTGGAWQDLGGFLIRKKAEAPQAAMDSP